MSSDEDMYTFLALAKLEMKEETVLDIVRSLIAKEYWTSLVKYIRFVKGRMSEHDCRRLPVDVGHLMLEKMGPRASEWRMELLKQVEWRA